MELESNIVLDFFADDEIKDVLSISGVACKVDYQGQTLYLDAIIN